METLVLPGRRGTVLLNRASLVDRDHPDCAGLDWTIARSNPMIQWISGNFVEGDNPNSNRQFWTASDLALSEYTIKYSPLNMIHNWRQPIGFFAETRQVHLRPAVVSLAGEQAGGGTMKIQALAGLWQHVFPEEARAVQAASDSGDLYYSMECTGSHLRCLGPDGCGNEYAYADWDSHCEHLKARTSIRHIVNPVFRGGAVIIPPTRPGWKGASAEVLNEDLLRQAAALAEHTAAQYEAANQDTLSASAWEVLMAMVIAAHR